MEERFIKLTNSVYKVLEFFPESDPLKNRAKDKALAILENPKPEDIDILLGYLQIAKSQGWLNSANCLIICNEYEKIKKEIEKSIETEPKELLEPVLDNTGAKKEEAPSYFISDRQKKILEFLKKNDKAQVMDLQAMLPDVTKRTIRRDLDKLLEMGQIERDGTFNQVIYKIKVSH